MASSSSERAPTSSSKDNSLKFDEFKASIDMNCSICCEVFTDPFLLKCGHTFCKLCTERLIISARETAQQRYHYGTPTMSCPECRAEMPADRNILVKNYRLADIINRFNSLQTDLKDVTRNNETSTAPTSPPRPNGIMCSNCKELSEPRHLFYCSWCSSGRSDPLFACGTCCVHHHGQHQLTAYSQMATPEERQAFVLDSLLKLNDVSIHTHNKLAENRVMKEYDNCRNFVQETFVHLEPVLNNFISNQKLTKQQLGELSDSVETYMRLCQDTTIQMQKLQMKHGIEWSSIRDAFSTKTSNIFSQFTQSGAPAISMPATGSASSSDVFSVPLFPIRQRSRRLISARRRFAPSTQATSNNPQSRFTPPDNSDEDL